MVKPALRAVGPGESKPKPRVPLSVTKAAAEGTPRELLVAMRDRIALSVEDKNTAARDLAALTRRLLEIARDIEAIDAREAEEGSGVENTPDAEWDAAEEAV